MANKQLEGQIFSHNGTNYLVVDDNDWEGSMLKVKSVDTRRQISELPLAVVLEGIEQKRVRNT